MVERLQDEKRIETIRRKERNDLHIYTNIQVFLEDCFDSYLGLDLFDLDQPTYRTVKVKKTNTLEEVHQLLAETFVSEFKIFTLNFKTKFSLSRNTNQIKLESGLWLLVNMNH